MSKPGYDDSLFYWRLCDELSIVDAAILIIGENPSARIELYDVDDGYPKHDADGAVMTKQKRDYPSLEPVMKALRSAIFGNRLRAKLSFYARGQQQFSPNITVMGEPVYRTVDAELGEDEVSIHFSQLLTCETGRGELHTFEDPTEIARNSERLWLLKEPAWDLSTVEVSDLKVWLEERGITPAFFFPRSKSGGLDDSAGPRFAPKLACAVAAWNSVKEREKNMSVKESLALWVQANGVNFGLGTGSGVVPQKAVEEISTVANWNTKGGANPTSLEAEPKNETPIKNLSTTPRDFDPGIPF